jgi:hypothetical protein
VYDPPGYLWAIIIAGPTAAAALTITPSNAPITQLLLALIPTATVPLLFALYITSVTALVRAPRTRLPATAPLTAAAS